MPEVFPYFSQIGYESSHGYRENLREYDDGTYRRYLRSVFNHRKLTLKFTSISKTKMETIRDFFNGRKSSTSDSEFIIYDRDETDLAGPDLSGMDPVGQHKAMFLDSEIVFTREGKCRWGTTVRVKLLS